MIDLFILAYERQPYTEQTLKYLRERTKYPYRLFLIDNGANMEFRNKVDHYIQLRPNMGVHAAWNVALSLAESEYFITSDNDIYVPDLRNKSEVRDVIEDTNKENIYFEEFINQPCWLERMVKFMDERPDYGAISLHPHVFIGAAGIDPQDPEDVKERNMCGAVMRIMRTKAVIKAGGWERKIEAGRNHEERTICSRLQTAGYKVGITSRIRAYHPFGKDIEGNLGWGYTTITPEEQGHNPRLKDEVLRFDYPDAYDNKTWLPL